MHGWRRPSLAASYQPPAEHSLVQPHKIQMGRLRLDEPCRPNAGAQLRRKGTAVMLCAVHLVALCLGSSFERFRSPCPGSSAIGGSRCVRATQNAAGRRPKSRLPSLSSAYCPAGSVDRPFGALVAAVGLRYGPAREKVLSR